MPYKDPIIAREKTKIRQRKYRLVHPAVMKERDKINSRHRRVETKIKVLSNYGRHKQLQCSWPDCPIIDIDMLCLDHVNDDGFEQRRSGLFTNRLYEYLLREGYPEGYQTLCANHNLKKELLRRRIL
jgi:hypothetical protein